MLIERTCVSRFATSLGSFGFKSSHLPHQSTTTPTLASALQSTSQTSRPKRYTSSSSCYLSSTQPFISAFSLSGFLLTAFYPTPDQTLFTPLNSLRGETGTDFEDYDGVLPDNFTYRTPDPSKYLDADAFFNQYAAYSSIGGGIGAQVLIQNRRPSSSGRRRLSNASSYHEEQQVRSVPSVAVMSDDETAGPTNGAASERTPLVSHTAVNIGGPAAAAAYLPLPLV